MSGRVHDPDLPEGFVSRPATDADLDAVVDLIGRTDRALGVEPDPVRDFLKWIWHVPSTDLDRDTRVIHDPAGLACFSQGLWNAEEGGPLQSLVAVHPDRRGLGLGTWGAARNEALAADRGSEGVRARIPHRDDTAARLLSSRGYLRVRSAYTMRRDLLADEDLGSTPAGVTIRTFETGRDERVLHEVNETSFAGHWGFRPLPYETFAVEMYDAQDWDPHLALLAEVDDDVVGHAVSFASDDGGHVGILGVIPSARGRGIAKALLRRSFSTLADRGHRVVRLGVDAQNPTGAVALYEGVGMTVSHAYDMYDLGTPDALRV